MLNPIYILTCITILAVGESGRLPIQAHSFNDLDYIINLIGRGVDHYKMDVSMANRRSCQKYSTWNKSSPCIQTQQYIQQVCCLAMRGDASSRPDFAYPFNTSTQFTRLLEDQLAKIVINEPNRRLLFAVNFQYKHTFDQLTDQFLASLGDVMEKYPHNLLLGTGMDDFILQYDRICYGKGAPECTDIRRKISKSNMFLQSGGRNPYDVRDYYKRFRNFNVYYKGVDGYCRDGFPQWMNNHPQFPLIFWQPSDEKQIQRVLSQFFSPSCMKKHGRNASGMAIATNIDPQMFDVYSRKLVEPISFSNWLITNNGQSNKAANVTWSVNTQKLLASQQINYRFTKTKQGSVQTIYAASSNIFINKLLLQKWIYNSKSQSLTLAANRQVSNLFSNDQVIQQLLQDGRGHLILITYRNQTQSPSNIYYFNIDSLDMVSYKEWGMVNAAVMRDNELIYATCQNSSCSIKGAIQLKQTKTYAQFDIRLFASTITGIQLYPNRSGFIVVGDSSITTGLAVALLIEDGQLRPPAIPLSYGQSPKIFSKQTGKQYGVLLSNAMCHCAVLFNNNNHNKCNFFKEPQLESMRNVRGIVNLIEFNLPDLIKNSQPISPCHPKMNIYKVMIGVNPDIVELPTLGSYLIGAEYLRVQDQDFMAALFCGASNFDKNFKYKLRSTMLTAMYLTNYTPIQDVNNNPLKQLITQQDQSSIKHDRNVQVSIQ